MRGYKYHALINDEQSLITLRPHWSTYAKAFAPALVIWGGASVMFAVSKVKSREIPVDPETETTP